ncbi:MAG: FtsX-like permease family protein [Anaerolineae bacterium]|jgi:putative ABC transport system permease protein|nr:FtsX-like permease family protein [Anaerolineae bacterium]MBT7782078.1 FtsX-like permease family protein [Anaerolineae bacterium]
MNSSEVFNIAWAAILKNKVRSLLTMLGIIIGVAAVIVMVAISAGTEATINEEINSLGANLVFVQSTFTRGGASGLPEGGLVYDDAAAIAEGVDGVSGVVVEQSASQTIKANGVVLDAVTLLGSTADFPSVRDMSIEDGRYFNDLEVDRNQKVAVLGSSLAEELFGEADPIGQDITVGTTRLVVIGVLEEKGLVGDVDYDSRLYMPISVVLDKFTQSQFSRIMGDRVRLIYVEVEDQENLDNIILQIQLLLAKRHDLPLEEADFTVTTQQDIIGTQEATTAAFRSLLGWVAGVSLIVGGIGIMNIMLVSVTERTREIGIRQSIGATPSDIRWQFLTEALLLSLVGGLLGVIFGVGGAWIFGSASGMRTVVVTESIVLAFSSAALVGAFFGFYPANKAAELDPIEALRHE